MIRSCVIQVETLLLQTSVVSAPGLQPEGVYRLSVDAPNISTRNGAHPTKGLRLLHNATTLWLLLQKHVERPASNNWKDPCANYGDTLLTTNH